MGRPNRLNDLTGTEWVQATRSIMFQHGLGSGHPETSIERLHPAPFAFKDAEKLIRLFSRTGEAVLDPFAGVGSTLKACAVSGRFGTGIELSPRFVQLARRRLRQEVPQTAGDEQIVLQGDARRVIGRLADDQFAFILTSPPYWNILAKPRGPNPCGKYRKGARPYSDDPRDFGCIEQYERFVAELAHFVDGLKRLLQPRRYLAIIVADFRHRDTLYPLQADLIRSLRELSEQGERRLILQGIKIIAQNQKALYPYGFPTTYVPNIHHHYVLIFRNMLRGNSSATKTTSAARRAPVATSRRRKRRRKKAS
jgi:hypothetical protein